MESIKVLEKWENKVERRKRKRERALETYKRRNVKLKNCGRRLILVGGMLIRKETVNLLSGLQSPKFDNSRRYQFFGISVIDR